MSTSLTVNDETTSGHKLHTLVLGGLKERLTVRELIRARIQQEATDFNSGKAPWFQGFVAPVAAERSEHGYKLREHRNSDAEQQCQRALRAFEHGEFVVEIGDEVARTLDQVFEVGPATQASFVKLAPLVAG